MDDPPEESWFKKNKKWLIGGLVGFALLIIVVIIIVITVRSKKTKSTGMAIGTAYGGNILDTGEKTLFDYT